MNTYASDIFAVLGAISDSGGLNFTGSRLLTLSKNSDTFLAGVEGITNSGGSVRCCCCLSKSSPDAVELGEGDGTFWSIGFRFITTINRIDAMTTIGRL